MLRPVFDTNVPVSAFLSPSGTCGRCIQLAELGKIELVTCKQLLAEFEDKLFHKFNRPAERVRAAVENIRGISRVIEVSDFPLVCSDPDDDIVLACAVRAAASHIVTGDKKHLIPLDPYHGIRIISPTEFLHLVDEIIDSTLVSEIPGTS